MEIDAKKSKLHLTFQQWMFKVFINYVLHFTIEDTNFKFNSKQCNHLENQRIGS